MKRREFIRSLAAILPAVPLVGLLGHWRASHKAAEPYVIEMDGARIGKIAMEKIAMGPNEFEKHVLGPDSDHYLSVVYPDANGVNRIRHFGAGSPVALAFLGEGLARLLAQ